MPNTAGLTRAYARKYATPPESIDVMQLGRTEIHNLDAKQNG